MIQMKIVHIDFEVPNWSEVPIAPAGVVLSQVAGEGYPGLGTVAMRAAVVAGNTVEAVSFPIGNQLAVLAIRFVFNASSLAGGNITVLDIESPSGVVLGRIVVDPIAGTVALQGGPNLSLAASYAKAISWHCVEVNLELTNNHVILLVDGLVRAEVNLNLGSFDPDHILFGVTAKDENTSGILDLDEFIVSSEAIGVANVAPQSEYAESPERWLALYNRDDADSSAFAQAMHDRRGIPYANLIGLALPSTESITGSQFTAIRSEVAAYLDRNGLRPSIMGIICGHGVPGRIDDGGGASQSVSSMLSTDADPVDPTNPLGGIIPTSRLVVEQLNEVRLGARFDGATLASSIALLDRGDSLASADLNEQNCGVYLDLYGGKGPSGSAAVSSLEQWRGSLNQQHLRLPLLTPSESDPGSNVNFTSIAADGFFWGWSQATVQAGFFADPPGVRIAAVQIEEAADALGLLRTGDANEFGAQAIASGYAVAVAATMTSGMGAIPDAATFFEALRLGWTIAEAWHLARPMLGDPFTLVGDPFLRIMIPKEGFDLYGGAGEIDAQDTDKPIAYMPPTASLDMVPASALPADGQVCSFAHRRTGADGRAEASWRWQRLRRVGDLLLLRPGDPAWPRRTGWSPRTTELRLSFAFVWGGPPVRSNSITVELVQETEGLEEIVLASAELGASQRRWLVTTSLPSTPTRFRLRMITQDGVVEEGPWSVWLSHTVPATSSLDGVAEIQA